jgi:glycosyltransferase involved in cell wall biosynthesis
VVIPSYDNVAHIDQTMRSVLAQTYADLEIVVSDHGSTDGTWEALQRFSDDPRVTLTRISPGGGAARNWNHATTLATGDLVKLVCADDLLAPTCVEEQVDAFAPDDEGVVMVASRRDLIDAEGRTIARGRGLGRLHGRVSGAEVARAVVRAGTNLLGEPACVMFRRSALVDAGLWDGADGYVIDLRTYLRVLERGDLVVVPGSLAAFRVSAQQWSVRLQGDQTRQVTALLRETAARRADRISRGDLALGQVMARLQAARRRLAYRLLARRL